MADDSSNALARQSCSPMTRVEKHSEMANNSLMPSILQVGLQTYQVSLQFGKRSIRCRFLLSTHTIERFSFHCTILTSQKLLPLLRGT